MSDHAAATLVVPDHADPLLAAGHRRMSLVTSTTEEAKSTDTTATISSSCGNDRKVDAAKALTDDRFNHRSNNAGSEEPAADNRRGSMSANVEYAIAMANENPELDDDDRFMCPFGTRRDSLVTGRRKKRVPKPHLNKKNKADEEKQS